MIQRLLALQPWRCAISMMMFTILLGDTSFAHGGVMAERTRLIFNEGVLEQSMMLANTNNYPVVLQSWIGRGEESDQPDNIVSAMLVLPPVVRMQPHEVKSIRVLYTGSALPTDRESVFWLNLYEIPLLPPSPQPKEAASLALGINTQMKVFYRADFLVSGPDATWPGLRFTLEWRDSQWLLICDNQSPYHASFVSLKLKAADGYLLARQLPDMMTPPYERRSYPLDGKIAPTGTTLQLDYTLVDDTGNFVEGHGTVAFVPAGETHNIKALP